MGKKATIQGLASCIGMLILILDSKTAISGVRLGLELCMRTVIPSLFPFFVLSALLIGAIGGLRLSALRPIARLCGIPEGTEAILACGLLGGYPVGAQSVSGAYRSGVLTDQEAARMLAFCNNAGPAFLFGMASSVFTAPSAAWILWGIHILSAGFVALIWPKVPGREITSSVQGRTYSLPEALRIGMRGMGNVCGWVILFRVLISFLERWILWLLPLPVKVTLIGLLELSNGCIALAALPSEQLRFVLCSVFLALGGACVTMQSISVADGLPIKPYLCGKMLQGCFSFLLALAFVSGWAVPVCAVLSLGVFFFQKSQKRVAFSA